MSRSLRTAIRRITGAVVLSAAIAAGSAVVAPAANAATTATWQYFNVDSDRYYDIVAINRNNNGYWDELWYDLDNDNRWDTHMYNTVGGDGLLEELTFNMDEDAYSERLLRDENQQVGYETAFYNTNDDAYWDSSRRISGYPTMATISKPTDPGFLYALGDAFARTR
jgi:hypothetical protein